MTECVHKNDGTFRNEKSNIFRSNIYNAACIVM